MYLVCSEAQKVSLKYAETQWLKNRHSSLCSQSTAKMQCQQMLEIYSKLQMFIHQQLCSVHILSLFGAL